MKKHNPDANRIIHRGMTLAPIYARAIREENMEDLLIVRRQLAATIKEADNLILDYIVKNIERRLAEDIERRLTE